MSKLGVWLRDAGERAVRAFIGAFLATVALRWSGVKDFEGAQQALLAAVAMGTSAAMSALAALSGNRASGSVQPNLPAEQVRVDPPTS